MGEDTMVREETKTVKEMQWSLLPSRTVTYSASAPVRVEYTPHKKNVIAIIPARGNSKRVIRKNMKLLGNKPLIQYTLDAALNAETIESIFVTTEDNEIGDFCSSYNSRIKVIRRPDYLARDDVQNDEVMLHAYRIIQEKGYSVETLVLLQPTSPFRSSQDIDNAVAVYYSNHETVIGVYRDYKFHWSYEYINLNPEFHNPEKRRGKQWIEDDWLYAENGSIYVFDAERFGQERIVRMYPFVPYIMTEEMSVDVDTEFDWLIAEQILKTL